MPVSEFTHEGTTYAFEPPIETGERAVEDLDLAGLVAVAQEGIDVPDGKLRVARLTAKLVMIHSDSDPLNTLNTLLQDKHQATIV